MADYKGVLADLRARHAAIEKERADLATAIAAVERLATSAEKAGASTGVPRAPVRRVSYSGLTMPQAIEVHFNNLPMPEPQSTRQIMDGLQAGGLKAKRNFRGHVYNTMHRLSRDDGPYRHEPDGRWTRRAWSDSNSAT